MIGPVDVRLEQGRRKCRRCGAKLRTIACECGACVYCHPIASGCDCPPGEHRRKVDPGRAVRQLERMLPGADVGRNRL